MKTKLLLFIILFSNYLFAETLNLNQGWNLVGINSQTTLQELKTQIGDENLLIIQGGGKTYKKTNPSFLNSFIGFEEGKGYWIKVAINSSLEFTPLFTPETIQLQTGWNLINPQELSLEELKTQVGDENILVIQGGGKTYKKTNPSFLNSFTEFKEPYGYWVKVQSDVSVLFDPNGEDSHIYGEVGKHSVSYNIYGDAIFFYPTDITLEKPTPVVFLVPGWYTTDLEGAHGYEEYKTLIEFIVSHGYVVIFTPTNKSMVNADKFITSIVTMAKRDTVLPYLDTSRIGIVGHSIGGGHAFYILKKLSELEGWGENGRFLMALDPWYAFGMQDSDMQSLPENTNIIIQKFGKNQKTDPRITLTEYYLLSSIADEQKDYQVYKNEEHSYPQGNKPVAGMQHTLKPLDALMAYTFEGEKSAHDVALEVGDDDPIANKSEEVLGREEYLYKCDGIIALSKYCEILFTKIPEYLETTIDSKYKTKITRITYKENARYIRHRYSKNQPWNSDSSLIKLDTRWLLNGTTYEFKKLFPAQIHGNSSIWSHLDSNKLFVFRDDGIILTYNVETDELKILMTIEGYDKVLLGPGEGNIDIYDKYVAFACKNNSDLDIVIVDLQTKSIVSKKTFKNRWEGSSLKWIDWVSVSQSGKYTVILWSEQKEDGGFKSGDVKTYNTVDLSERNTLHDYGNHGDLGFDSEGNEVYVQFAGRGSINAYRLKDAKATIIQTDKIFEIGGNRHLSCRNYKNPGWCFVSTDENGEIFAIKIDKNQVLKRLATHKSSHTNYKKSAMPVPNPTGEKVMFASDYGDVEDSELVYDFVVELQ